MTQIAVFDDAANDSDKSYVVPAGRQWFVDWIHIILTTTATVGNRQIGIQVLDESSNIMYDLHAGAVVAESLTRHIMALPGVPRETAFVAAQLQMGLPRRMQLLPGWTLRVYDNAAVDAAADDMVVSLRYDETLYKRDI